MRSLSRYEIRSVLGRGATGVVYEAYDPRTRSVVALKTLSASTAENLYRLKHEFRALYDVQHPNLVRLGELESEGGQWYLTMEVVRGVTFIEHVRPGAELMATAFEGDASGSGPILTDSGTNAACTFLRAPGELDLARLRAVLPQLVSSLAAIHDAGHVHRDVKPSNVLISGDGRLVLLDFGLVTARAARENGRDAGLEGTPAFMAPEQIEGERVGPAADWYAVGLMLYLALTARLPFEGTIHQILDRKLTSEAPSPRTIAPDATLDLTELCVDLLQMDPAARPTVDEIRARLGMAEEGRRVSWQAPAGEFAALFVGREDELRRLRLAFEGVESGGTSLVVVEGEAGVGKSAIVHHFLAGLGARATVLEGRCYEQETVPFKGIDAVLDALSECLLALPEGEVNALLGGGVRYLAAVFPVLNRVPAIAQATAGERAVGNASVLREQAFDEFERLLRALTARQPVVIFIDDLQWADRDSLALLERALGGGQKGTLFLATVRPGPHPEARALLNQATLVPLVGLSPGESRELWDALCPPLRARRVSSAQRDALMREASGHPLFLAELARTARDSDLAPEEGARLVDVLWRRIEDRDEVDRRFLEMVAIAGAPTGDVALAKAAGLEVGDSRTRLGSLRAAQLVRVSRRGDERLVEPYHDRIRESILLHLGDADRNALHLALGRALLDGVSAANDNALAQRIFAIVQHLNAARAELSSAERARAVELNLLAAREARLATAYDRAREYAQIGLELAGGNAWTQSYPLARDLHIERMQADFLGGALEEARACFALASQRITAPEDRIGLYSSWIELLSGEGRYADAIAAGREALDALKDPVPAKVGMMTVLWRYVSARRVQRGRTTADLARLPILEDRRIEGVMKILMSLAPPAFFSDTNLLTWILLRIAALSMRFGVSNVSSYGFGGYGLVLSAAFGKREEGEAFSGLALTMNERFQNLTLASKLRFIAGMLVPWVRPFADAKEHLRAGYEIALKIGDTTYECYSAVVLSIIALCESSALPAVQREAEWAREVSARRRDRAMTAVADCHARHAATLRGLTPSALDLGVTGSSDAEFRATLSDEVTPTALFYYQLCTADLAYRAGDAARARALLTQARARMQGIFGLPTTVELSFLDALVAAREHDRAPFFARIVLRHRVARELTKLKAWAQSCPTNFDAHAAIVEGELLRLRGRALAATASFDRAIAASRAHGSPKREALACELGARHARAFGDEAAARRLMRSASEAYRRWGATTKADALAVALPFTT